MLRFVAPAGFRIDIRQPSEKHAADKKVLKVLNLAQSI
jgi:hypothetical protein